jgi:hypothetical protein
MRALFDVSCLWVGGGTDITYKSFARTRRPTRAENMYDDDDDDDDDAALSIARAHDDASVGVFVLSCNACTVSFNSLSKSSYTRLCLCT